LRPRKRMRTSASAPRELASAAASSASCSRFSGSNLATISNGLCFFLRHGKGGDQAPARAEETTRSRRAGAPATSRGCVKAKAREAAICADPTDMAEYDPFAPEYD